MYIYIYLRFWSWVGSGSPKLHYPFMGWIASPGPIINSRVEAVVSLNFKLLSRSLPIAESVMKSMTGKRSLSEIYAFVNHRECDEIYDWKESSHLHPPIFSYFNPNIRHVPLYKNSIFLGSFSCTPLFF